MALATSFSYSRLRSPVTLLPEEQLLHRLPCIDTQIISYQFDYRPFTQVHLDPAHLCHRPRLRNATL
jgi:hypothetical protein